MHILFIFHTSYKYGAVSGGKRPLRFERLQKSVSLRTALELGPCRESTVASIAVSLVAVLVIWTAVGISGF